LGEIEFIIATKIFSRGTDMGSYRLPDDVEFFELRSAVLVEGTGSVPDCLQSVGRLTRPERDEEGNLIIKYLLAVRSDHIGRKGTRSEGRQKPKPAGFKMMKIVRMYAGDYPQTSILEALDLPVGPIPDSVWKTVLTSIESDKYISSEEKRNFPIYVKESNKNVLAALRMDSADAEIRERARKILEIL
jgi:hypothetical protein